MGERGQSMVEYALVLVPLLLLVMGIFDLGRVTYYYHMLSNAAREGARVGINRARTEDEICTAARLATWLPNAPAGVGCGTTGDLTVQVSQRGSPGLPADPVRVWIAYVYRPITPLIGNIVGPQVLLQASSTMYVEY